MSTYSLIVSHVKPTPGSRMLQVANRLDVLSLTGFCDIRENNYRASGARVEIGQYVEIEIAEMRQR